MRSARPRSSGARNDQRRPVRVSSEYHLVMGESGTSGVRHGEPTEAGTGPSGLQDSERSDPAPGSEELPKVPRRGFVIGGVGAVLGAGAIIWAGSKAVGISSDAYIPSDASPRSCRGAGGTLASERDEASTSYKVADFAVMVGGIDSEDPFIWVVNDAEPERVLWETRSQVPFVTAAMGRANIADTRGSFTITDTIEKTYEIPKITGVAQLDGGLTIDGVLTNSRSDETVDFSLIFSQPMAGQLAFEIQFSSDSRTDINRTSINYASDKDEGFFGFGEQLTFWNLKGQQVPIIPEEHGIGRGYQPITTLLDIFASGTSGSSIATELAMPYYITSTVRSVMLQ